MTLEEFVRKYSDGVDSVYVCVAGKEFIAPECPDDTEDHKGEMVHTDCGRPDCWGCQISRDRPLTDETVPGWKEFIGEEVTPGEWVSSGIGLIAAYSVWERGRREEVVVTEPVERKDVRVLPVRFDFSDLPQWQPKIHDKYGVEE